MTAKEEQLQLHPAADVFCDHLLSEVDDENMSLRNRNNLLVPGRNYLAKIELRLADGHVASTALKRSYVVEEDDSEGYVGIPIESSARPLSEYSAGGIFMLEREIAVGTFPGDNHVAFGFRSNGAILVRFSLSEHIAVEGVLRGLSTDDHERFRQRTFQVRNPIQQHLMTGSGLQNGNAITFTPTMIQMDISPELRTALDLLRPLPSKESVITHHLTKPHKSELLPPLCPAVELRLSVLAALGYTDSEMDMVCENQVLKNENSRLLQIKKLLESVEIIHPAFRSKLSLLEDGAFLVDDDSEGSPVWRILFAENIAQNHLSIYNIRSISMALSGMRLARPIVRVAATQTGVLSGFSASFANGATISGRVYQSSDYSHTETSNFVVFKMTVRFPISSVQTLLEALGVEIPTL